jgi:DNA-directed RNA polymerase-3 subunit RPC5
LRSAEQEQWIQIQYIDEETDRAYTAFEDKLFVKDTASAPALKSTMDDMEYLDAISAPRHDSPTRRRRRPPRRKRTIGLAAGDDEEHDEFHDDEEDEDESHENGTGGTAPDVDTQMVE